MGQGGGRYVRIGGMDGVLVAAHAGTFFGVANGGRSGNVGHSHSVYSRNIGSEL